MKKIVYGDTHINLTKSNIEDIVTRIGYCPVEELVTVYHKYGVLTEIKATKSNILDMVIASVDELYVYGLTWEIVYDSVS